MRLPSYNWASAEWVGRVVALIVHFAETPPNATLDEAGLRVAGGITAAIRILKASMSRAKDATCAKRAGS
jgi:hypothetical protein